VFLPWPGEVVEGSGSGGGTSNRIFFLDDPGVGASMVYRIFSHGPLVTTKWAAKPHSKSPRPSVEEKVEDIMFGMEAVNLEGSTTLPSPPQQFHRRVEGSRKT